MALNFLDNQSKLTTFTLLAISYHYCTSQEILFEKNYL